MHQKLTKEHIDLVFENSKSQSEYIVKLYRIAFPNWDDIVSVDGFPSVSEETSLYIYRKAIEFDERVVNPQRHYPELKVLAGGAWMNNGFAVDKDLPEWVVVQCDYTVKQ